MKQFFFIFISFIMTTNLSFANEILKKLDERMVQTNSLVCVGLDPDPSKIPLSIMTSGQTVEESVFKFLTEIVDITAPYVCSYKIQKAFYDDLDGGHAVLRNLCSYIHLNYPGIPLFIDCKIGDIDNTMQAYMHLVFDDIGGDGVVINPYMGDDVFEPFLKDPNKVAVVLIQTSNPSAKIVQELPLKNGKMLWQELLELTVTRWNKNGNMIPVLSANSSYDSVLIRKSIPQDTPILLAGIGSQGGNPEILKQLLNDNKRGVFVNSSRGILYPYDRENKTWQQEVLRAVLDLRLIINTIREDI